MKRFVIAGLAAVLASSSAGAQTLLQDTFAGENGGATQTNYVGFANWNVVGQVDVLGPGNGYGITCLGSCVDLDGSSGPGKLVGKSAFAFSAGDVMKISFDISGNQRGGAADQFDLGLDFGAGALVGPVVGTGALAAFTGAGPGNVSAATYSVALNYSDPFSNWSFQFTAASSGSVRYSLGTTSSDNAGPILDDVLIENVRTNSVVPEPSTWAMLAFGLGGLGVAARRRVPRA